MCHVLLIEDDPETGETIQAMLELDQHQVTWMPSGIKALGFLGSHGKDIGLVLCDILMPDMDGLEVLMEVRKLNPNLPFVSMTARKETPYLAAASHLGANGMLEKPFTLSQLRALLQRVCSH
jgi:CheY-like chemotaxis protein